MVIIEYRNIMRAVRAARALCGHSSTCSHRNRDHVVVGVGESWCRVWRGAESVETVLIPPPVLLRSSTRNSAPRATVPAGKHGLDALVTAATLPILETPPR